MTDVKKLDRKKNGMSTAALRCSSGNNEPKPHRESHIHNNTIRFFSKSYLAFKPKRLLFALTVLMLAKNGDGYCPVSLQTMEKVEYCPKTKQEWEQRAFFKNCSQFQQDCTDSSIFVYHCLPSTDLKVMVEVCAPMIYSSEYCCEFNSLGAVIQRNYKANCRNYSKPCTRTFPSTENFKFQECYTLNSQVAVDRKDDAVESKNSGLSIGFGIGILLSFLVPIVSLGLVIGWVYLHVRRKRRDLWDSQADTKEYFSDSQSDIKEYLSDSPSDTEEAEDEQMRSGSWKTRKEFDIEDTKTKLEMVNRYTWR